MKKTNYEPGLGNKKSRLDILDYLRSSNCFQGIEIDSQNFSDHLAVWYKKKNRKLPAKAKNLWELSGENMENLIDLYESLRQVIIGYNLDNDKTACRIESVAASKILFAIRPKSLIQWDSRLKYEYNLNGSAAAYIWYTGYLYNEIEELLENCLQIGVDFFTLAVKLQRPHCSILKLVEEHMFVQCRKML